MSTSSEKTGVLINISLWFSHVKRYSFYIIALIVMMVRNWNFIPIHHIPQQLTDANWLPTNPYPDVGALDGQLVRGQFVSVSWLSLYPPRYVSHETALSSNQAAIWLPTTHGPETWGWIHCQTSSKSLSCKLNLLHVRKRDHIAVFRGGGALVTLFYGILIIPSSSFPSLSF